MKFVHDLLLDIDFCKPKVIQGLDLIFKPGTSFQSPALSLKHVRNVCYKIN